MLSVHSVRPGSLVLGVLGNGPAYLEEEGLSESTGAWWKPWKGTKLGMEVSLCPSVKLFSGSAPQTSSLSTKHKPTRNANSQALHRHSGRGSQEAPFIPGDWGRCRTADVVQSFHSKAE